LAPGAHSRPAVGAGVAGLGGFLVPASSVKELKVLGSGVADPAQPKPESFRRGLRVMRQTLAKLPLPVRADPRKPDRMLLLVQSMRATIQLGRGVHRTTYRRAAPDAGRWHIDDAGDGG